MINSIKTPRFITWLEGHGYNHDTHYLTYDITREDGTTFKDRACNTGSGTFDTILDYAVTRVDLWAYGNPPERVDTLLPLGPVEVFRSFTGNLPGELS